MCAIPSPGGESPPPASRPEERVAPINAQCVSKAWRDLIALPAHRKKLPQTLAGILYTTYPGGYRYHLAGLSGEADGLDLDPSLTFLPHTEYRYFGLEHACSGLLLCSYRPDDETIRLVVCNPATRRWTELPPRLQPRPNTCPDHKEFHLAFDPAVPSHFHVFDFEFRLGSLLTGARIYSSRTGAWSQRDAAGLVGDVWLTHLSVMVGGMLHVVGNLSVPADSNNWDDDTLLVAVDMEGKVWKTISVPRGQRYGTVGWSQGCLHYAAISPAPLTIGDDDNEDTLPRAEEVAIWRLEDYDTQQWALKQSFRADKVLKLAEVEYQLVGFHPDRDTFFLVSKGLYDGDAWDAASVVSWDMRRRQICDVLDLEKGSSSLCLPYVPLFSSEPLADADGH
ncbi:hypothetical protein ZWY2020_057126 [Hordeum vulgare]|nr:hypothetical protein ZWY2020_057126 [Hordeum vulgare]